MRALRLEEDSPVRLTDGHGEMWSAYLRHERGEHVFCVLKERLASPPQLSVELVFGVANKSHTLWLVEKATELGASGLWPVEFARSRSVSDAARAPSFWRKAERRAVAAMKQAGGAWLPRFEPLRSAEQFIELASHTDGEAATGTPVPADRVLLDQAAGPLRTVLGTWSGSTPLAVLVGPEGGLTREEKTLLARSGFRMARLGPTILRFETAAVAALAIVVQHLETTRPEGTAAHPAPQGAGELHER